MAFRLIVAGAFQPQIGAVCANGVDFCFGSRVRDDHDARQAESGCGPCDAQSVIAGGDRQQRSLATAFQQMQNVRKCSTNLEGMGVLQVFEFEKNTRQIARDYRCRANVWLDLRTYMAVLGNVHSDFTFHDSMISLKRR